MKMQAQDIYKRCCLAAVAATFFCTSRGAVYEDSLVSVDKGTVVRHLTDRGIVYVFTATNDTTVTLKQSATLDAALVVGGGGSGGTTSGQAYGGGGGGGGVVYRTSFANPSLAASDTIALQVGPGGEYIAFQDGNGKWVGVSSNGLASVLNVNGETITAYGGGHGGYYKGQPGEGLLGSGGGSGIYSYHKAYTNGVHYTEGQGFPGGIVYNDYSGSAGGGGASEAGVPINASVNPGKGGEGVTNDITGVAEVYGSGGGGFPINRTKRIDAGRGGTNAGDAAGSWITAGAVFGRPGFGGGGGGASNDNTTHGGGGSGTVILRFAYPSGNGKLIVLNDQVNDGSCTPGAGEYELAPDAQMTLTAASGPASGGWRWSQVGYSISESIDGGVSWTAPTTNYSHRVDFIQKGTVWTRLTWLWTNEEIVRMNGISFPKNAGVTVTSHSNGYLVACSYASGKAADIVLNSSMRLRRTLVVGGGGAGGRCSWGSGGGGGGGVLARDELKMVQPGGSLLVRVGAGGAAPAQNNMNGANGESSTLWDGETLTEAYGGGGGAGTAGAEPNTGSKIASGGGSPVNGGGMYLKRSRIGFNHVHYTLGQGWPGGLHTGEYANGSGGGGAGGMPTNTINQAAYGGNGGEGITNDITGVAQVYGSGGGGSTMGDKPNTYDVLQMAVNGLGGTNAGMGNDIHTGGRDATSGVDGFGGGGGAAAGGKAAGRGGSGAVLFYYEVSNGLILILR